MMSDEVRVTPIQLAHGIRLQNPNIESIGKAPAWPSPSETFVEVEDCPSHLLYLRGFFATAKDIPYIWDQRFVVVDHPCLVFPHEFFPRNCVAQCFSVCIDSLHANHFACLATSRQGAACIVLIYTMFIYVLVRKERFGAS